MVALIGAAVILGWVFDVPLLKSVSPAFISMKLNTAICFSAMGAALWCRLGNSVRLQQLARVLATGVALVCVIVLMEYALGWDAGIDNVLIVEPPGTVGTIYPGRMAIDTALAFILIAAGILLSDSTSRWSVIVSQVCALVVMAMSWVVVLGYCYSEPVLAAHYSSTPMALHTGFAFFLLSGGVLSLRPGANFMGIITSDAVGGHYARTWIPVVIIFPLVLDLCHHVAVKRGMLSVTGAEILELTVLGICFVVLVVFYAASLNREHAACQRLVREEEQAKATRERSEFIAFVSHELRNPLTVIQMGVDTILEGHCGPVPDEARSCLEMLNHHVHRMTCLVKDVLDYQKLVSGKMESTIVPQELNPVVLSGASEVAGAALDLRLDDSVPKVMCDRDMIAEVVTNLLSNAVKYSDGSRIQVKTEADGGAVKVSITDHGMGIREEDQAHLFQEFYRVHDGGRSSTPGTGLGLALCKKIVEAHHGQIGVQSVYGHGATFWFTLPVAPRDALKLSKTDSSEGCRPESSLHG